MTFDIVWQNIISCAGQEFYTKRHHRFTYKVEGESVIPDHTGYPLTKNQFQKAFEALPLTGPGQINREVRGPSYVFAILTDERINHVQESL